MISWVDEACRSWGFYVYELIESTLTNLSKGRSCRAFPRPVNNWSGPLDLESRETRQALKDRKASQSEIQAAWEAWELKFIKAMAAAMSGGK